MATADTVAHRRTMPATPVRPVLFSKPDMPRKPVKPQGRHESKAPRRCVAPAGSGILDLPPAGPPRSIRADDDLAAGDLARRDDLSIGGKRHGERVIRRHLRATRSAAGRVPDADASAVEVRTDR